MRRAPVGVLASATILGAAMVTNPDTALAQHRTHAPGAPLASCDMTGVGCPTSSGERLELLNLETSRDRLSFDLTKAELLLGDVRLLFETRGWEVPPWAAAENADVMTWSDWQTLRSTRPAGEVELIDRLLNDAAPPSPAIFNGAEPSTYFGRVDLMPMGIRGELAFNRSVVSDHDYRDRDGRPVAVMMMTSGDPLWNNPFSNFVLENQHFVLAYDWSQSDDLRTRLAEATQNGRYPIDTLFAVIHGSPCFVDFGGYRPQGEYESGGGLQAHEIPALDPAWFTPDADIFLISCLTGQVTRCHGGFENFAHALHEATGGVSVHAPVDEHEPWMPLRLDPETGRSLGIEEARPGMYTSYDGPTAD